MFNNLLNEKKKSSGIKFRVNAFNCDANSHKSLRNINSDSSKKRIATNPMTESFLRQKCGITVRSVDVDGDRILLSKSPSYVTARILPDAPFMRG